MDDHPVTQDQSFRKQLGVVLQDSTFYAGSVRDNILMGRPHATEEEIHEGGAIQADPDIDQSRLRPI